MKTSIFVQNLKCGGCAKTISSKIAELNNISDIEVDIETSKVSFISQNSDDTFAVKDKLKALGYPAIEDQNTVISKAKSFVSCATGRMS